MAQYRLDRHAEARCLFDSCAAGLKAQDFQTWQEEVQWHRLHEVAKHLILTMPQTEGSQATTLDTLTTEVLDTAVEKTPKIENNLDAPLKLGDYVRIRHSGWRRGRIVELRDPRGPQGAQINRVMVKRKPKPVFIEVREDQLEPVAADS